MSNEHNDDKQGFFDRPGNVKRILWFIFIAAAVLFPMDLIIETHPHFGAEGWPFFYGTFGFCAFVVIVMVAKYILRPLVKRREDYYD